MGDPLRDAILALLKMALIDYDKMFKDVEYILTLSGEEESKVKVLNWDAIVASMQGVADVLFGFCLTIAGICLLIELVQILTKVDIIKWEHGLKVCVKMALSVVFIYNAQDFLLACYYQGMAWIGEITTNMPDSQLGAIATDELEIFVGAMSGLWAILGLFMTCVVLVLAIKACGIIVQVIAFMRMFEILVLIAISPVPFAFFPLGNGDGSGFSRITAKFLKNFAAVCLQGVMMIVVLKVFDAIVGSALEDSISLMNKAMTEHLKVSLNWWTLLNGVSNGQVLNLWRLRDFAFTRSPNKLIGYEVTADIATIILSDLCFLMLLGSIALVMSIQKCGSWAKSILDGM